MKCFDEEVRTSGLSDTYFVLNAGAAHRARLGETNRFTIKAVGSDGPGERNDTDSRCNDTVVDCAVAVSASVSEEWNRGHRHIRIFCLILQV